MMNICNTGMHEGGSSRVSYSPYAISYPINRNSHCLSCEAEKKHGRIAMLATVGGEFPIASSPADF